MNQAPAPQTGASVFAVLAILCAVFFCLCGVYGVANLLFPGIGEVGRFFAIGTPFELGLLPGGLLACLFAGLWLAASGHQRQAGLAMAGAVLISVVAYYLYSESSRRAVLERIEHLAQLPTHKTRIREGEPLVDWRNLHGARCGDECQHLLYNGHVEAYVVSFTPAGKTAPAFRVFRLSTTSCPEPFADLRDRTALLTVAILRVADHCIVAADRADPPDGIWLNDPKSSPGRPDFPFFGQFLTLTRQDAGTRSLIRHHEAGNGHYPTFPPMSCWVRKFKTVPLHFCSAHERYGRKRKVRLLIGETLTLENPRGRFTKKASEIARIGIGKFTQRYDDFSEAEKARLFRSLALAVWEHPDLDRDLAALVALGLKDSPDVARTAEDAASIAEKRRLSDRRTRERSKRDQPLTGGLEAQ